MASPLAQFEIKKLIPIEMFGYDISFTNSSLAMLVTVFLISIFMFLGLRNLTLIPSKTQSILESSYEFVSNMIGDNIGNLFGIFAFWGVAYFVLAFSISMYDDYERVIIDEIINVFN